MLKIEFVCPLENGLHARPASEIEQRVNTFSSSITLVNTRNQRHADARSVLAIISADVLYGDPCTLLIEGDDEQDAHRTLGAFMDNEFAHCDAAFIQTETTAEQPMPVFLAETRSYTLRGYGVSAGMGRGIAVCMDTPDMRLIAQEEGDETVAEQKRKLQHALETVIGDLTREQLQAKGEAAAVLEAHLKLLGDASFKEALLNQHGEPNALSALSGTIDHLSKPLRESRSTYLQQRVLDLKDLGLRLAEQLTSKPLFSLPTLQVDSIVISSSLITPGQFLTLNGPHLKGIVMSEGGETSHTVILARSLGIPLLCVNDAAAGSVNHGDSLLIDSRHGILIIDPDEQADLWFELELDKEQRIAQKLLPLLQKTGMTRDGEQIAVLANIALPEEADTVFSAGAEGIGLFRTEMLFCERTSPPDEEEQYQSYRYVLERANGKKVVIRTLDIGGDKPCDYLNIPHEENPFLGWRAIRLYPSFMAIFTSQVRALLRASATGPLHIMVPMISTLEEVKWFHHQFHQMEEQLNAEGVTTGKWDLGIMVEVPSTLYLLEKAAKYITFVSIGSNDLLQYFLACDRGNAKVSGLYNYRDPSFLCLLRDIIDRAHNAGLNISLCGEMGGDGAALPLLLGTGLRQISMSASRIRHTKMNIPLLDTSLCQKSLEQALACDNADDVKTVFSQHAEECPRPILDPALVMLDQSVSSKAEVIKRMADNLEIEQRVSSAFEVEQAIWQRESVFSTALGFSVALPHCKSSAVTNSSVSLMRLDQPIHWGEGVDVSLVIMLTVSETGRSDHMKIFSKLARKILHEEFRAGLMNIQHTDEIISMLNKDLEL
jgi:phosphoenolpyruvate-protein phosphotransferase